MHKSFDKLIAFFYLDEFFKLQKNTNNFHMTKHSKYVYIQQCQTLRAYVRYRQATSLMPDPDT